LSGGQNKNFIFWLLSRNNVRHLAYDDIASNTIFDESLDAIYFNTPWQFAWSIQKHTIRCGRSSKGGGLPE